MEKSSETLLTWPVIALGSKAISPKLPIPPRIHIPPKATYE